MSLLTKSTQTKYVPLADTIVSVKVINDNKNFNSGDDDDDDDGEDCWGCCCLMLWYILLIFLSIFFFLLMYLKNKHRQ